MKTLNSAAIAVTLACVFFSAVSTVQAAVSQIPAQLPLFLNNSVPPLNMLVVGRDHKLFFPAYNDASDLDGDGAIDIRYKPDKDFKYLGYFDSGFCYTYANSYFSASGKTDTKKCPGSWSGDYLNYLTTSRADALRKVLYGGYRYVDSATQTILSRAYISTDAHTWGKEYKSVEVDGYDLHDYTPFSKPTAGNYALFANNSQGTSETSNPPLLRVVPDIANVRIFGWVSRESTQGGTQATDISFGTVDLTKKLQDFAVRVEVCKSDYLESNCKLYPNGKYKPTGILHDYGEGNQMYFGLLTGTYTNNLQGGALRRALGSFSNEIEASTGIFGTKSGSTYTKGGIIGTLDGLKLAASTSCSLSNGSCPNWGNPLAEMMFETLRYFSGNKATPTDAYKSGSADNTLGLTSVTTWTDPYSSSPNANATNPTYPSCSKPFETLFSDVNPSYDSDLPGSAYTQVAAPSATTPLTDFKAADLGQTIWNSDIGGSKNINIGQTLSVSDSAPTAKVASSLGNIRGLPEEPTKEGTYNAAAVAYYGNTHAITSLGSQKVQTFSIALSSTLPRIQMPVGTGTITLVPFGKVANNGVTEQITGFYIDSLYNMAGQPTNANINGGRAQAVFRVVFDDCVQGCDYDMDAIVLYTVAVNASGTLDVTSQTVYSVSSNESHMGYTISGTTADGIYLEVTGGGSGNLHYSLDTPGAQLPGTCSACNTDSTLLPGRKNNSASLTNPTRTDTHTRNFKASATTSITNLKDPLWYAAKWGGFGSSTNIASSKPVSGEWDSNTAGTPNNYFLVTNASTLKDQLSKAFNQILQKNSSVATPAVIPTLGSANSASTYLNSLDVVYWSGDLTKTTTTFGSSTATTTVTTNWKASEQMPAWGSRNIQMAKVPGTDSGLQSFTYANLAGRTYASINLQGTLTSDQLDFVKGDISKATSTFRRRASLIGDLVNSSPVVVNTANYLPSVADSLDGEAGTYSKFQSDQAKRRGQVYVGANDGMLHAFDTTTGVEKFAFIPTAVISNLNALTNKNYNSDSSLHRYFVDGTPVVADVYISSKWRTVLVGTLGGGGSEIFALDVTEPDNIKLLWEFTAQTDAELGSTFSKPVIARLHSGKWGVVVGNGYNGNNGNASLIILDVATGATISKLTTSVKGNNGLSSPVILDANSDGIADYAYAGDLLGNLWRFDLIGTSLTANTTASSYKVSFGNNPLYTATTSDTGGTAQSITAPPVIAPHPTNPGNLIIFGTGRYFATADKTSTDLQSLYGIWDKQTTGQTAGTTPLLSRAALQAQSITTQATGSFAGNTNLIRLVSNNTVNWASKSGWYLDLAVNASLLGERLVDSLVLTGDVLYATTRTPSFDVCTPGITGWIYGLDPTTGGRTTSSVFNLSRNGIVSATDKYNDTVVSAYSSAAGGFSVIAGAAISSTSSADGMGTVTDASGSASGSMGTFLGLNYNGRQTWRVIPSP
ncbi:MAG TPA: PilC/PilY family type IV pilus protein [Pseudomonas sp.]|uniref:pilus assembly protein n=1 Tax=Pseudomonas sp. TaxID=306 RepID=UPI002ED988C6